MLDVEAYLERIGVTGRPSLAEIHRGHNSSIPFENLDPHRGVPVSLERADIERKLVAERRGGYCFEQNLLLKSALEALGAKVDLMLARVRMGARDSSPRPRSHLVLRVRVEGGVWHADVGFGADTLLQPIPFGPGGVYEQLGWRFRVVSDGQELVLQAADGGEWKDLYGFVAEPVPFVDLVTSNWFTCTHPRSPFVTGLVVTLRQPDGTRLSLSDWDELALTKHSPDGDTRTPVARSEIPRLLETHFGLSGFSLDGEERIVRTRGA